jgi:hypothetical protein
MRTSLSRSAAIAALAVGSGCYVPDPADLASLAPGEELRIVLSDQGVAHLRDLSTVTSEQLHGQLSILTADSVTITTRLRGPAYAGSSFGNLRQALTFAREDIRQVTVPRLDPTRTAVIAASAVIVAITVIARLLDFVGSNDRLDNPTDPNAPFHPGG